MPSDVRHLGCLTHLSVMKHPCWKLTVSNYKSHLPIVQFLEWGTSYFPLENEKVKPTSISLQNSWVLPLAQPLIDALVTAESSAEESM